MLYRTPADLRFKGIEFLRDNLGRKHLFKKLLIRWLPRHTAIQGFEYFPVGIGLALNCRPPSVRPHPVPGPSASGLHPSKSTNRPPKESRPFWSRSASAWNSSTGEQPPSDAPTP